MEKCMYAFDYVDLKNKEYERKHTKPRQLGDVDGKYRFRPRSCTPTLVGSLVNLEIPETRAINTNTAKAIIANQSKQIQGAYEKNNRAATLDAWSYSPLFEENQHNEGVHEHPRRPHTAAGTHGRPESGRIPPQVLRPFSTGSPGIRVHPNAPPQLQKYMTAKLKRRHSGNSSRNVTLKTVTTALQAQWEEEDRSEQQSPRRVKSQNVKRFDSFAGQWLSFAGGTEHDDGGGVLDAFTGEAADEYYNVESRIGANIACQLNKGNKIRVGKNGVLQSNSLKVNKWKNEIIEASSMTDSCSTLDSWGNVKPVVKPVVPLSWDDQLAEPDVKVIEIKDKQHPPARPDLCERHPVKFEKFVKRESLPKHKVKLHIERGYKVSQRTKNKRNIDGTESLNNRITMISVDDVKDDSDSMCSEEYEELLYRSLQTTDFNQLDQLKSGKKDSENVDTLRKNFTLSPPAPSLNESQESLNMSDNVSYNNKRLPTSDVNLTKINLSPDDLERHETPSREMFSASSTSQRSIASTNQYRKGPVTPRHFSRPGTGVPMSTRTRSQTPQAELPRKRAQSSPPRRMKHYFNEPPTHARVKSPRPILAKPGQLPRSGVSSISASTQDGAEQEYIKISHQILPSSHSNIRSYSAASRASEKLGGDVVDTASDIGSVDSMDVNKGDHEHHFNDEHVNVTCTCSPEARRVLSAALSHLSNASDPNAVISIPTGDAHQHDRHSNHDSDEAASFYSEKSDPLDGLDTPLDSGRQTPELSLSEADNDGQNPPEKATDQITKDSTSVGDILPNNLEEDIFINKTDGLSFDQQDMDKLIEEDQPKSRVASAGKHKRTVKFADEQNEETFSESGPLCTPSSTPREQNSDSENG